MEYVIHIEPGSSWPYKDKYLYVTDTVISIEGMYNDFYYSNVNGGIIQRQKKELEQVIFPARRAQDSIESLIDSADRGDTVSMKRLISKRRSIMQDDKENVKTFIRQHPAYLVSAALLADNASAWGKKQTDELYALLTPEMKKTKYGRSIQNYLSCFRDFKVGDTIPDFALPDEYGRLTSLYSCKSRFILLDFWFAGCGPCRQYNRLLAKYYTGLHAKGLTVFSVSVDKNADDWKEISAGCGICWPNVRDSEGENGKLATTFGLHKYPTSYLLSKNGVILAIDIDFDQLKEKIYKQ
jgi:peroxiredoxin